MTDYTSDRPPIMSDTLPDAVVEFHERTKAQVRDDDEHPRGKWWDAGDLLCGWYCGCGFGISRPKGDDQCPDCGWVEPDEPEAKARKTYRRIGETEDGFPLYEFSEAIADEFGGVSRGWFSDETPGTLGVVFKHGCVALPASGPHQSIKAFAAAEGFVLEEGKRNCWTCGHSGLRDGAPGRCSVYGADAGGPVGKAIGEWARMVDESDDDGMPPRDADGCPGWEAKEEADPGTLPKHYPGELRAFFLRVRDAVGMEGDDCEAVAQKVLMGLATDAWVRADREELVRVRKALQREAEEHGATMFALETAIGAQEAERAAIVSALESIGISPREDVDLADVIREACVAKSELENCREVLRGVRTQRDRARRMWDEMNGHTDALEAEYDAAEAEADHWRLKARQMATTAREWRRRAEYLAVEVVAMTVQPGEEGEFAVADLVARLRGVVDSHAALCRERELVAEYVREFAHDDGLRWAACEPLRLLAAAVEWDQCRKGGDR